MFRFRSAALRWVQRLLPAPEGEAEPVPWAGEVVDVERFWADSWIELCARQDLLMKELKLAEATWRVDQEAGLIEFLRVDETVVRAPVQIVGSYNPRTEMFLWAWDHPSVAPRLRASAERTRWFGNAHKVAELTERQVKMSEADAWRLTAVAMKVNAAFGAYRGPTDGPIVFMTLGAPSVQEEVG